MASHVPYPSFLASTKPGPCSSAAYSQRQANRQEQTIFLNLALKMGESFFSTPQILDKKKSAQVSIIILFISLYSALSSLSETSRIAKLPPPACNLPAHYCSSCNFIMNPTIMLMGPVSGSASSDEHITASRKNNNAKVQAFSSPRENVKWVLTTSEGSGIRR